MAARQRRSTSSAPPRRRATGRSGPTQQLTRFYDERAAARDRTGARRITYLRLAKLADEANLDYDRRDYRDQAGSGSVLEQMDMHDGARPASIATCAGSSTRSRPRPSSSSSSDVVAGRRASANAPLTLTAPAVDLLQGGVVMDPAQRRRCDPARRRSASCSSRLVQFVLLPSLVDVRRFRAGAGARRPAAARARPRPPAAPDATCGSTRSAARPPQPRADGPRRNPFRMGAARRRPAPEGAGGCRAAAEAGHAGRAGAGRSAASAAGAADSVPVHRRARRRAGPRVRSPC